jgi:hypothetical protein
MHRSLKRHHDPVPRGIEEALPSWLDQGQNVFQFATVMQ